MIFFGKHNINPLWLDGLAPFENAILSNILITEIANAAKPN